jgi:hypothetical protein
MKNKNIGAVKLFYKFLKEEGIWNLYWHNVSFGQKNNWIYTKITRPESFLNLSFSWRDSNIFNLSNDEYNFWENIDAKWRKFYEENK